MGSVLVGLHCLVLAPVMVLVLHRLVILVLYLIGPRECAVPVGNPAEMPSVTVQLPVYNEPAVVDRLLDGVCSLNYPLERLEVQVLDDSDDETTATLDRLIAERRAAGIRIEHLRRGSRHGYKAGALNYGLPRASGELIAIFDADFIPDPAFLLGTVAPFADGTVAAVQTRWGYLNRTESWLTRMQVALLDTQFEVEHRVRARLPLLFHTCGSGVVWRRAAIEQLGGWPEGHSAEDLDLAYLAQMDGWKIGYRPSVLCRGELPHTVPEFETQQMKWAYVGTRSAIMLAPRVWTSSLPFWTKLDAIMQLLMRWSPFLALMLALLWLPTSAMAARGVWPALWVANVVTLIAAQIAVLVYFMIAQGGSGYGWAERFLLSGLVCVYGLGLSLVIARGCISAVLKRPHGVPRTPKGKAARAEASHDLGSLRGINMVTILEGVMGGYLAVSVLAAAGWRYGHAAPFLAATSGGLFLLFGSSLLHELRFRRSQAPAAPHRQRSS